MILAVERGIVHLFLLSPPIIGGSPDFSVTHVSQKASSGAQHHYKSYGFIQVLGRFFLTWLLLFVWSGRARGVFTGMRALLFCCRWYQGTETNPWDLFEQLTGYKYRRVGDLR
jgi:hypothetical protein